MNYIPDTINCIRAKCACRTAMIKHTVLNCETVELPPRLERYLRET